MALGRKKQQEEAEAVLDEAPMAAEEETPEVIEAEGEALVDDGDAGEGGGDGTDSLLSMFENTETVVSDLANVLELTPEVEMDDLLEDLRTTAAALGCEAKDEDYSL